MRRHAALVNDIMRIDGGCHPVYAAPMNRSERLMVRLEPEVSAALRSAAQEEGRSISQFIERLIVADMKRRQLLGNGDVVPLAVRKRSS